MSKNEDPFSEEHSPSKRKDKSPVRMLTDELLMVNNDINEQLIINERASFERDRYQ